MCLVLLWPIFYLALSARSRRIFFRQWTLGGVVLQFVSRLQLFEQLARPLDASRVLLGSILGIYVVS